MTEWTQAEVLAYIKTGAEPRKVRRRVCTQLELELPLPPKAASPNARSHWAVKAKAVKKQREDSAVAARLALIDGGYQSPRWERAEVEVTLYRSASNARRLDSDNLLATCKGTFDGLQDAGVLADDRGVTHLPPKQFLGKEAGGENKMVLVVRPTA